MKIKDFKKAFLKETENVEIKASESLTNTPITAPVSVPIAEPVLATNENVVVKTKKSSAFKRTFMPLILAACFLIIAVSLLAANPFATASGITAYAIEINPSISIITDADDNVINICSINEDADTILSNSEFDDVLGESFETAVEKIIKVVSENGVFNGYQDKIRIYALNDDKNLMGDKLGKFGNIVENKLQKYGHGDIEIERREMTVDDFKGKMEMQGDFDRLDDMKRELKERDRYKNPPPDGEPPHGNPPEGNNPPPDNPPDNPPMDGGMHG